MSRHMVWITELGTRGWACSQCDWRYSIPSLLSDPEARNAYDRLAQTGFQKHTCADHLKSPGVESFSDRVRKFVTRGYKPKDAVEIVLDEVMLEHRNEPKVIQKARDEAEEFLRQLRQGRI